MYWEITFYKHLGNLQNIPPKLFWLTSGRQEKATTTNGLVVSKALEVKRQEKQNKKKKPPQPPPSLQLCALALERALAVFSTSRKPERKPSVVANVRQGFKQFPGCWVDASTYCVPHWATFPPDVAFQLILLTSFLSEETITHLWMVTVFLYKGQRTQSRAFRYLSYLRDLPKWHPWLSLQQQVVT